MKRILIIAVSIIFTLAAYSAAQQKAVIETPATVTYTLNSEASQAYTRLEEAKQETIKQYNLLQGQQMALLIGAGVPQAERDRQAIFGKDGTVSFAPKSPKVDAPKEK